VLGHQAGEPLGRPISLRRRWPIPGAATLRHDGKFTSNVLRIETATWTYLNHRPIFAVAPLLRVQRARVLLRAVGCASVAVRRSAGCVSAYRS
jgi:hypothetical protein